MLTTLYSAGEVGSTTAAAQVGRLKGIAKERDGFERQGRKKQYNDPKIK